MDCFRLLRGPSTRHWFSLKWFSSTFHSGCFAKTLGLPRMTMPYLALVRATFRRLGSLRNPMPYRLAGTSVWQTRQVLQKVDTDCMT